MLKNIFINILTFLNIFLKKIIHNYITYYYYFSIIYENIQTNRYTKMTLEHMEKYTVVN